MKMTLQEMATLTGAKIEGDSQFVITGAAGLSDAGETDVSFLENPKYIPLVEKSNAGAIFLPHSTKKFSGGPKNRLYSDIPRGSYAKVLQTIKTERWKKEPRLLSSKADIHFDARLGSQVAVGSFTVIRSRTLVGENTVIGSQCTIGYNVRIGKNCVLHPQVVIGDYCELGDNVIIHPGTVVGCDGYGYWTDLKQGVHNKVPQVGRVIIEEDVELGANVTIDRATTGVTRIGAGTKIDNLVQIGHNVIIGRSCIIISQVGISGSTQIGNLVTLAGQAGIAGHLKIEDGAVVTAQTGVMNNVPAKSTVFGSPARPHRQAMKLQVLIAKLPEMYDAYKKLRVSKGAKEEHRAKK